MKRIAVGAFFIMVALVSIPVAPVYATDPMAGLSPADINDKFRKGTDAYTSGTISETHSVAIYKKPKDKKPAYTQGSLIEGQFKRVTASSTDRSLHVIYEDGSGKNIVQYVMKLINKGDTAYINFPPAKDKNVKGKWFTIPQDKYLAFGESFGVPGLFTATDVSGRADAEKATAISMSLERKHALYERLDEGVIDDGFEEYGATRYDFGYNAATFAAYFKELGKSLNSDQADMTLLGLPGFKEGLSEKNFVSYVVDRSYVSMWFDDSTKQPVRVFLATVLPGPKGEMLIINTNVEWNKTNVAVNIQTPVAPLSFSTAINTFNIDAEILETLEITQLKEDLKEAETKTEQADANYLLAEAYSKEGIRSEAAKYFKKAASLYPKKSVDQYDALAQAAWSLGDFKKLKLNFDHIYKKQPNDLFLRPYGWLLLGLTPLSAKYQDLALAKDIHSRIDSDLSGDNSRFMLYLSLYMLGEKTEAEKVRARITNFETADNLATLTLMYHRLGDKKNEDIFRQKAQKMGYLWQDWEKEFLAATFK